MAAIARRSAVVAERGAHAGNFIGSHRRTYSSAIDDDAARGESIVDEHRHFLSDIGIVGGRAIHYTNIANE